MQYPTAKHLLSLCAVVPALGLGLGCAAPDSTSATSTALTTDDVDLAPECAGILTYTNAASFAELDSYLPATVANAIVQRRSVRPFVDLADLSSVSGIAQARLALIAGRARAQGFIGNDCAGVYEELAVSQSDEAAILAYVNTASEAELSAVVRFEAETTVPQLIAKRPLTALQQLADSYGVGPDTFRALRDAAIDGPFDLLVSKVNGLHRIEQLSTKFNWYDVTVDQPGQQGGMECFGVDPALVSSFGGVNLPGLADGAEVMATVTNLVSSLNHAGALGDTTAALADLAAQVDGQSFFGCYISFMPNPWSSISRAFYVNTKTGYRVLVQTGWAE